MSVNDTCVAAAIGVGQVDAVLADEPHRGQTTDARRERQAGVGRGRGPGATPPTVRSSDGVRPSHAVDAAGVGLGVGDLAVAVGIEGEARLEGRDLRLVDDDVEEDRDPARPGSRRSG